MFSDCGCGGFVVEWWWQILVVVVVMVKGVGGGGDRDTDSAVLILSSVLPAYLPTRLQQQPLSYIPSSTSTPFSVLPTSLFCFPHSCLLPTCQLPASSYNVSPAYHLPRPYLSLLLPIASFCSHLLPLIPLSFLCRCPLATCFFFLFSSASFPTLPSCTGHSSLHDYS